MKKGRPGLLLGALCRRRDRRDAVARVLLDETTTLGVRFHAVERIELDRELVRGGDALRRGARQGGAPGRRRRWGPSPEYEDCLARAREHGVPGQGSAGGGRRGLPRRPVSGGARVAPIRKRLSAAARTRRARRRRRAAWSSGGASPGPTRPSVARSASTPRAAPAARSPSSCRPAWTSAGRRVARRSVARVPRGGAPGPGPGTTRALLDLSRELAQAHAREDVAAALARALSSLFPGRAHCIRLRRSEDARAGQAWSAAPWPLRTHLCPSSLRRAAVRHGGLSEAALESGGRPARRRGRPGLRRVRPRRRRAPWRWASQLFGVVSLEYPRRSARRSRPPTSRCSLQVANPAALGVRNLRSVEELTFLKTYLEELLENANALIVVTNRAAPGAGLQPGPRPAHRPRARGRAGRRPALAPRRTAERERTRAVLERSIAGEAVTGFETRLAVGRRRRGPGGLPHRADRRRTAATSRGSSPSART